MNPPSVASLNPDSYFRLLLAVGLWSFRHGEARTLGLTSDSLEEIEDLGSLIRQSVRHNLFTPLVALGAELDWGWPDEMNKLSALIAARNEVLFSNLAILLEVLDSQSIPHLLLKGTDLSLSVYRDGPARAMSDLDILIRPQDVDRVNRIFQDRGYRNGMIQIESRSIVPFTPEEELLRSGRYELPAFVKFNSLPAHGLSSEYLAAVLDPRFCAIEEDSFIFLENYDVHTNISYDIDVADLWRNPRPVELAGRRFLGQSATSLLWFIASRHYHEIMMSPTPPLRKFLDVLAIIERLGDEIDYDELVSVSEKYALNPSLFYMFWHANLLLEPLEPRVPANILRRLNPASPGVLRAHDWGDFMPKLTGDVVATTLTSRHEVDL